MMIIDDLLRTSVTGLRHFGAKPEMDPLTEGDALQEAQLLDVRLDALRSMAALLFELRMALQLRTANTGILVAYGIRDLRWSKEPRLTDKTAWNILSSRPRCTDRLFHLRLGMYPDAVLELTAESAAFYAVDVPWP